jgi:hypothetical protein
MVKHQIKVSLCCTFIAPDPYRYNALTSYKMTSRCSVTSRSSAPPQHAREISLPTGEAADLVQLC